MTLDERALEVLQHVVEAYVDDPQPVSSGVVVKKLKDRRFSSATIRSVMVELEAAGLLMQPHTSAGRVPTEIGFRTFLDSLGSTRVRSSDRSQLDLAASETKIGDFPGSLGQRLAALSGQVAIVAVPRFLGTRIKEVGLAHLDARRFIAFFVSPGGAVQQKQVELEFDVSTEELTRAQNYLNEQLSKSPVTELRRKIREELAEERSTIDGLHRQVLEIGERALPEPAESPEHDLYVEGAVHLVGQPDFSDLARLRELLEAIEERTTLLKLVDSILDGSGVQVMLGSEHDLSELPGVTCVGAPWIGPAGQTAAVSLLGPARMNYGRLLPLVGYATRLLGRYWERL